jgi:hypothetical protein
MCHCHFVYRTLHKDWSGIKLTHRGKRPTTDCLKHGTYQLPYFGQDMTICGSSTVMD